MYLQSLRTEPKIFLNKITTLLPQTTLLSVSLSLLFLIYDEKIFLIFDRQTKIKIFIEKKSACK